jgi:5'-methylthioadenosine phosphorylase
MQEESDMTEARIAVIGGSGVYQIEGAEHIDTIRITTPFGITSDAIQILRIGNANVAFLPRHGEGHVLLPSEVPHRANIYALKYIGVRFIIALSVVGSLKEEIAPCDFVIPDQIIDRTKGRPQTFFGEGISGHVYFADPFCSYLNNVIYGAVREQGHRVHSRETYVTIEGPMFSTRAESKLYHEWGGGVVGQSAVPEAMLAREAEISYSMIAMSTDYDAWLQEEGPTSEEAVLDNIRSNTRAVKRYLPAIVERIDANRETPAHRAAATAILTDPSHLPLETRRKLDLFYHKYWSKL